MLTQKATDKKSVQEMFRTFPKANGFIQDVIDAYDRGELTENEVAEWLLEYSIGRPLSESHTAVRQRYATTRRSRTKLNPTYRVVYNWMVTFKNIHPQTAWQYVSRLQQLASTGKLNDGVDALIERITQDPSKYPNTVQCLAALKLFKEYQGVST